MNYIEEPYGYIYVIQSKRDERYYVGLTTRYPEERYYEHLAYPKEYSAIDQDLLKYGELDFEFVVIDEAYSKEELNALEESYICLFGSKIGEGGYNIRDGGVDGRKRKRNRRND